MFAAKNIFLAGSSPKDPYFPYVSMLLPGNGTNGAQNNTFLDSSTNNFAITRNGSVSQGTFTPFGANWSNYFNGANYLSVPDNNAFLLSGDFTIEAWVYRNASGVTHTILAQWPGGGIATNQSFIFRIGSSNYIDFVYGIGASNPTVSGTTTVTANQWVHVAVTRSGSTVRFFVNGQLDSNQPTVTGALNDSTGSALVGVINTTDQGYFNGYISNLRLIKGVALYTSNFTPPTAPLTAISGTSLLTCQSNRFIDNSSNAFAITVNGTPSVQSFSPFSPTTSYGTGTIGGSGYFGGSGNFLNTSVSPATLSGDFTFECWVNLTNLSPAKALICLGDDFAATGVLFNISTAGRLSVFSGNSSILTGTTQTVLVNTWNHVAFVRSGGVIKAYLNGVADATTASNASAFTGVARIGQEFYNGALGGAIMTGYMSNLRIVNGTAIYTTNFTPPTSPLTAITNTSFLMNFTNGAIIDNAMINDLETVGNAQISTTQSKFGGGSIYCDGTGDWLAAPNTVDLQLGAGDFTIEGWIYLAATGVAYGILSKGNPTTGFSVNITSGNKLQFSYTASNLTGATSLVASTWYHFAVVRSGTATGNVKIYLNGVADATSGTAITDNFNQANITYVGADRSAGSSLNGYIDDLRVTKGYARYTANFTPPTQAFPTR